MSYLKFILLLILPFKVYSLNSEQINHLDLLNKTWNVAKMYHSGSCTINWDDSLLNTIPQIVNANDSMIFNRVINELLDLLGENQISDEAIPHTPELVSQFNDLSWLDSLDFNTNTKNRIQQIIDEFRPRRNCFVNSNNQIGNGDFSLDERYYNVTDPNPPMRLLALFRFWGIYNYYSPYKHMLDKSWSTAAKRHIDAVYSASNTFQYSKALARFVHDTDDTHGFFRSPSMDVFLYPYRVFPFVLKTVEGKLIVFNNPTNLNTINIGDEVISIDGVLINDIREKIKPYIAYSNPVVMIRKTDAYLNENTKRDALLKLRNSNGEIYETRLNYSGSYRLYNVVSYPKWTSMDQNTCSLGYVNMGKIKASDIRAMMSDFEQKDAIIFDLRNYPNGTVWTLIQYLYNKTITIGKFSIPLFDYPGGFKYDSNNFTIRNQSPYRGRTILLINEGTQSQGEFTALGLGQSNNAVIIGSQTAAADGDVSTVRLPGLTKVYFTGLGVYNVDDSPTQRIGIVPDLFVKPNIANVKGGIDDVLQAALNCDNILNESWPKPVKPKSALFWDPKHSGTGIDIAEVGDNFTIIPYDYRSDGSPVWYLGVAQANNGIMKLLPNSMREFEFSETNTLSSNVIPDTQMDFDFKRGPQEIQCAMKYQELHNFPSQLIWQKGQEKTILCEEELIFSYDEPQIDFTGLWWGGESENGWGISINTQGEQIVALVYFYDDNGKALWLLGSASFNLEGTTQINLRKYHFCKECTDNQYTSEQVATITLSLKQASTEFTDHNWMSLTFGNSIWNRHEMPIKLLSNIQN